MANEPSGQAPVSFVRLFMRFLFCIFAFLLACWGASAVAVFGLYRGLEGEDVYLITYLGTVMIAWAIVASTAFLPVAVFAVLAEAFAVRAMLVFASVGGLLGSASAWLESDVVPSLDDPHLLLKVAGGIAGGWVYWLMAGRKAGDYRERIYNVSEPQR